MGQVAAIGALLLIHGGLTGKIQWLRYLEPLSRSWPLVSMVKRRTKCHGCLFNGNRFDELLLPDKNSAKKPLASPC